MNHLFWTWLICLGLLAVQLALIAWIMANPAALDLGRRP